MSYTRPDLGARLAASSVAPQFLDFIRGLEGQVESCQCGTCAEALHEAPAIFATALLSLAGRATAHDAGYARFCEDFLPYSIGDIGCSHGSC